MKKVFTLLTLLLSAVTGAWATDYYTPSADEEVIILNSIYDGSKADAGYSNHAAVVWGGTASASSKKAGDPDKDGEATSSTVECYSIKGNGKGKNINLYISGCSKIILYHEKHSSRYVELRSENKSGTVIGAGVKNTYYTEVDLDANNDYNIFLHGTTGSDDQDFYVYAVKLIKGATKTITSETLAGVKVDGTTIDASNYTESGTTITLNDSYLAAPTVALINHIVYSDDSFADKDVDVELSKVGDFFQGTATIGEKTYTVKVPVNSTPTITATPTSITVTSAKAAAGTAKFTLTGANLTGTTSVTLSSSVTGLGVSPVKFSLTDGAVSQEFTITYHSMEAASGSVNLTLAAGANSVVVPITYSSTAADVTTITDVTGDKEWDFSKAGSETINSPANGFMIPLGNASGFESGFDYASLAGDAQYFFYAGNNCFQGKALKFHTTVPGYIIVTFSNTGTSSRPYRFLNVNGTNTSFKSKDATAITTTAIAIPAGDVVLKGIVGSSSGDDATPTDEENMLRFYKVVFTTGTTVEKTIAASGKSTFSSSYAVDFSGVTGLEAYTVSALSAYSATLTKVTEAPANTGLLLIGTPSATYNIPIVASAEAVGTNFLKAAVANKELAANSAYVLKDGVFCLATNKGSITAGKAYLLKSDVPSEAAELSLDFDGDGTGEISTGIENVEAQKGFLDGEFYNLNGQRVAQPTKGLYIVNGRKVIIK